jgi:hypothetical protein
MDADAELRKKGAELISLREEAVRIVAKASSEGRALTDEEDAGVLALMKRARAIEEEIHRRAKGRPADS